MTATNKKMVAQDERTKSLKLSKNLHELYIDKRKQKKDRANISIYRVALLLKNL